MGQAVSVAFCPGNRPKRGADGEDAADSAAPSPVGAGAGATADGYDLEAQILPPSSKAAAAAAAAGGSAGNSALCGVIDANGQPKCNCAESGHAHGLSAATTAAAAALLPSANVGTDVVAPFKPLLFTMAVGPLQCNMSIVGDPVTKEAVLVDPGGDAGKIIEKITEMGVKITKILITHAHFDHFLAAGELRKETGAQVFLHQADRVLWEFLPMQLRMLGMVLSREAIADIGKPDAWLTDKMQLGLLDGVVIHTPGHSEGSCCFYFHDSRLLLAGDTLFRGAVGRSDMLGGSPEKLKDSIVNKLYTLPDEVTVITGHGPSTMIGHEKRNNSYIRAEL